MFNQLSSLMKAALFYGIAFALILLMVLLGQGLGGSVVASPRLRHWRQFCSCSSL